MALWHTWGSAAPACFSCCRDYCFYWCPDRGCPGAGVRVRGGGEAQSHGLLGQVFNKQQSQPCLLQSPVQKEPSSHTTSCTDMVPMGLNAFHSNTARWASLEMFVVHLEMCQWIVAFLQALGWRSAKKIRWLLGLNDSPSLFPGREILPFC